MKNIWKKLLVGIFALAMIFTGMSQLSLPGNEVQAEDSVVKSAKYYVQSYTGEQVKAYKDAKTAPVPTPDEGKEQYNDWIFAGWFTDEDCTGVLETEISEGDTYYAKYVPAEVLSVKAQVKDDTTSETEKTDMRLVATVDSLRYKSVGFEVYYDNATTPIKIKTTSVFTRIEAAADGVEYGFSPNIFDSQSEYFVTATLKNIANKNFAKTFYIRPYVETLDGTISYGVSRYARVEDSYLNIVNIPVRVVSDATTATTGNISVAYPTGYFIYTDTYGTASTPGYLNGNVFDSVTVDGTTTAGIVAITGTAEVAQKVNGEVAHLRLKVNDGVTLPKKNVFTITSDNLTEGVVVANSVYNYFGIAAAYSGTPDTSWFDENETEFVITTPEELYGLASLVNTKKFTTQTVYLGSDIVVNAGTPEGADGVWGTGDDDWSSVPPTHNWTPIAKQGTTKFAGTFDGQGHTISGIYASQAYAGVGLFGEIADGAYVSNFKLIDSYFTSTKNGVAALCGWYAGGTIEGIYTDAYVKATAVHAGGLVMGSNANATIRNCWFAGQVDATQYVGGISGFIPNTDITIESCLNTGKINGTSQVGGILGRVAAPVTVNDTLSTGTVTVNTSTTSGAIAGWIGTVGDSVGSVTCTSVYSNSTKLAYSGTAITGAETVANLTGLDAYENTELDFENYWVLRQNATPVLKSWVASGALYVPKTDWTGTGTEKAPYVIKTPEQLYGLAQTVNAGETYEGKYFKLGSDIRINTGNAANWGTEAPKYTWIPIGTSTNPFKGYFNTKGSIYSIKGLYATASADSSNTNYYVGLFGYTAAADIQNIKVLNSYFEASAYVGSVVGCANGGNIDTVYSDSVVRIPINGGSIGGGIVAIMTGGNINNAWYDGQIISSGRYLGGVLGIDGGVEEITNCLMTGSINCTNTSTNVYTGGLLGLARTDVHIENCLVAANDIQSTKTSCYGSVIGSISDSSKTDVFEVTAENIFVLSDIGNTSATIGRTTHNGAYITGTPTECASLTGANAYKNTYLTFDRHEAHLPASEQHDGVWVAREGKAPGLKKFVDEDDVLQIVKQDTYRTDMRWYNETDTEFTINNAEEFAGFMQLVNNGTSFSGKTVQLGADITLNAGKASDWYAGKGETNLYNWIPIGNGDSIKFSGTFDGKGHTISGVYADHKANGIGLFGRVAAGSEVRDFKLTNSYFAGNSGVGSVAGWYAHGTYDTIYSDAIVHGLASSGGHYGGMLGLLGVDSTIKNCWFAGTIKSNYGYTGGIVGTILAQENTTIESCLNTGNITGTYDIGGIVGRVTAACTIKDSFSKATLKSTTGSGWLGHIAGRVIGVQVTCDRVYALGSNLTMFKPDGAGSLAGTYASVADLTGANGFLNTWLTFDRPELPTPTTGYWVATDGTPELKSFSDARIDLAGASMYRADTRWYDSTEPGSETIGEVSYSTYVIDTAEELVGFSKLVNDGTEDFENAIVYLGKDITLNKGDAKQWYEGTVTTDDLYNWTPIAKQKNGYFFKGRFEGQQHTISGIYASSADNGLALFGQTADGSRVADFKLVNSYFSGKQGVAPIGGWYCGGTFESIYTNAYVKATGNHSAGILALACIADGSTDVKECWFDGTLYSSGQYAGGITSHMSIADASLESCLVTGSIESTHTGNAYAGVLVGNVAAAVTIKDCLADAEAFSTKSSYCVGSVAGFTTVAITSSSVHVVDGLCDNVLGKKSTANSTAMTTAAVEHSDLTNYKGYMNTDFDFDNTWVAMEESAPRLQIFAPTEGRLDTESWYTKEGADGTEENPYIINAVADMYGLAKRVNTGNTFEGLHIKLDEDLTFNKDTDFTKEGYVPEYAWTPIGTISKQFKGKFNEIGDMHKIEGLYVNATGDNVGLFGYTNGATIKNLEIVDSYIKGTGIYVSAVAGYSLLTTIDAIHVDATVIGSGRVGGFAGRLDGGSVNRCWFEGTVESTTENQQYTGAIVGQVGGSNAGVISNCLAEGTVKVARTSGNAYTGGILGGSSSVNATITNCISAVDSITTAGATGCLGSFVGGNNASVVTTSGSYVINVSGLPAKVNGTGASGGTYTGTATVVAAEALYDAEAYEKLNAGYWAARVGNYPIPSVFATDADYAKAATKNAFYLGDTTFEQDGSGAYLISSAAELYGLASLSQNDSFEGKTFKLTNNITINHQTLDANTTEATSYEWLPIGSSSVPFKGTFNGDGHTISGLYKYFDNTYDKGRWTGLFDTTEGCVVENLNIENTYFTYVYNGVNKDPSRIGSIAGYGGGTFRNIRSTASLINDGRGTGGIIGQSTTNVEITNCWFGGEAVCKTTFQSSYLGGLIGFATAGDVTIAHSHVSGDVLGGSYHVGGLVGNIQGAVQATITDSMFNGNFKASDDIQGDVFKHGQLVGTVVANAASATGGKAPSLKVSNCYGVNNFASYDIGALTSYTHTDETVYTPIVTGSGKVSVKEDRLIGYAGNTAGLDYSGYWVLTKSGTPMLKSFVKANDIYDGSQLTSLFKLDTFGKTLKDAEEVGAGRYTIKITGSTKAVYDQYCEALDVGIFNPYNNDQSSDLNGEGVYNKVYTSAACGDASNDDWYINATYSATSDTNGTITITVSSAEVLSQHLKADSIVSYAAEDGYTTSGLTPTFHMIEQKYQAPAASYVIQLSNGHLIVIDGGIDIEAPYLMEYLESLVPDGKKPIVEAWVLSHAHMDHIDSFRGFVTNASKYQGKVYLEGIYFSEASDVVMSTVNAGEEDGHHHYTPYIHRIGSVFPTTKGKEPQIYRMYTGQRYTFDTVVMDVMLANEQFAWSDYQRAENVTNPSVFNETSTWTMFTINGKKLLTAGDSNYIGKEFVVDHYSEDYLTVDIFTALHHGENINREQSATLLGTTDNDEFSNAITVKGAVLYAYPTDWYQETSKTTIKARIKSFMNLQVDKGMSGIAATYESGSTAGSNPEDYFYHGQGTVVLTFGDSITANVKAHNDWANEYTVVESTTEE